jgi:hypothetical protein
MISRRLLYLALPLCLLAADDTAAPWKSKQIPDWTESDAKDFLNESPWVKSFTPGMKAANTQVRRSMNPIGMGGIGLGVPGMGGPGMGGARRGMGYPGGGYPSGQSQRSSNTEDPPKLTLRWESAMPVRSAEIKAHDNLAPTIDEKHYAIAVYGIPDRLLDGDTKKLQDQLKKEAAIKPDGKKDFKPSSVEVLERPDGPVVVYFFSNSTEIAKADRRAEFDATIGRLILTQSFFIDEMVWQGKIEL